MSLEAALTAEQRKKLVKWLVMVQHTERLPTATGLAWQADREAAWLANGAAGAAGASAARLWGVASAADEAACLRLAANVVDFVLHGKRPERWTG